MGGGAVHAKMTSRGLGCFIVCLAPQRLNVFGLMIDFQFSAADPETWVGQQLDGATLGDPRRQQRAQTIAAAMARQPGVSFPQMFERKYDIDATYAFLQRPEATPANIQAGHRQQVLQAAAAPGDTVLFLEDGSQLIWNARAPIAGLGPLGTGHKGEQGFILHSVLSVRWPGLEALEPGQRRPAVEVLGLADQQYHVRQARPPDRPKGQTRRDAVREFESQLWERAGEHLGPAPAGVRWVRVDDREADIYEYLVSCQALGHGFVVRAAYDRKLEDEQGQAAGKLFEVARALAPLGEFDLLLRARAGQAARTARLSVACAAVRLRSPQRPGHGAGSQPPIVCTVVRVWEAEPPEGVAGLEWMLLTDAVVERYEQALEVALQYGCRWLIEEFHKGLKTGLGAERLQLEQAGRLFAAIALMSLVALRLIDLREAVRVEPEAPAEQAGLSALELAVLRVRLKRPIGTVREVALAIGRLGGHMNRKSDGLPGWQTLWRGMKVLELLVQGVNLYEELETFQV